MESTVSCARCGHQLPPDALFCPGCGVSVQGRSASQRDLHRPGRIPPGTLLRQRYYIERKLAQGGHSAVYLARDTFDSGTPVALKEMRETQQTPEERDSAINSFMREERMLAALKHPALARVHDIFVEDGHHYLVMEYVPGYTLEDEMMALQHPVEWTRVVGWGIALCDVLAYLHRQQPPIVYRDLKPPNVMLTPEGQLKLIDFGIARWFYSSRSRDTSQLGTDGYAPPEQYAGRSEPRSDLYALGASLYHLMTGRVPESAPQRMNSQPLTAMRALVPGIPEAVERVVQQAMSLAAADRFVSAEKMGEALEATFRTGAGSSSGRHRIPTPEPIPDTVPRHPRTTMGPAAQRSGSAVANANNSVPKAAIPPRLSVRPLRLDAGYIAQGSSVTIPLEIANRGHGALSGHIETNIACLHVSPKKIDGSTGSLAIVIDTAGLKAGQYVCHLAVRTNGGDQTVPVRFVVTPANADVSGPNGWGAPDER
ncbi:MAG: protein kinase domain-containing protein [Nitrososphaerota archaeon]